jgi:putative endopeptidase
MQSIHVYILFVYFLFLIPVNGESFFDINDLDWSIRPSDDFFTFVNGRWVNRTIIPPSQTIWGSVYTMAYENSWKLKGILDELTQNGTSEAPFQVDSVRRKLGDLYLSGLDEKTIEETGIQPLKETFIRLQNVATYQELIMFILDWYKKMDQGLIFQFDVYADERNTSINMPVWRVRHLFYYINNYLFYI